MDEQPRADALDQVHDWATERGLPCVDLVCVPPLRCPQCHQLFFQRNVVGDLEWLYLLPACTTACPRENKTRPLRVRIAPFVNRYVAEFDPPIPSMAERAAPLQDTQYRTQLAQRLRTAAVVETTRSRTPLIEQIAQLIIGGHHEEARMLAEGLGSSDFSELVDRVYQLEQFGFTINPPG